MNKPIRRHVVFTGVVFALQKPHLSPRKRWKVTLFVDGPKPDFQSSGCRAASWAFIFPIKATRLWLNNTVRQKMNRWWTIAKWTFKAGVAVWFVALPLMPIYGWLRPWPHAEEALRSAGVYGVPLMIGAGSSAHHTWSSAGHVWQENEQRSFLVMPESFRDWKLFTYFEVRGSGIKGTKTGVDESAMLIPLFVMWIVAGWFSIRTFRQLRKRGPNKPPQRNAGSRPSSDGSSASQSSSSLGPRG